MKKLSVFIVNIFLIATMFPVSAYSQEETAIIDVLFSSVNRKTREQRITVIGQSLPKSLSLSSDSCDLITVISINSEKSEFSCSLKKVSTGIFRVMDAGKELKKIQHDIVEVYEAALGEAIQCIERKITIKGSNLPKNILVSAPKCQILEQQNSNASVMEYLCRSCGESDILTKNIRITIKTKEGLLLFQGNPQKPKQELAQKQKQKKSKKKKTPEPEIEEATISEPVLSGEMVILDSNWLRLICDTETGQSNENQDLMLGTCRMTSPFIRKAVVESSLLKDNTKQFPIVEAVVEGEFETRLGETIDAFTQKLGGLKINPASGHALFSLDVPEQAILLSGTIKGVGLDASSIVGFPLDFNLYDYSGELLIVYPVFNISKPRSQSKVIFGIGNIPGNQITILKSLRKDMASRIEKRIKALNVTLNQKKIEVGAKLMNSINNITAKKIARESYIKFLKALEIVPETIAFYDNFDFVGKVKLKSEPFRPASWGNNSTWYAQANLATLEMDLSAHNATLMIKGDILNNLSIFSSDVIKADRGLINAQLIVKLKDDEGSIDLDPVEVRIPGDFAKVNAKIHISHIFQPRNLVVRGNIKSGIEVYGLELVKANASLNFDPNQEYRSGDFVTIGVLDIGAETKLIAIGLKGRAVFTHPEKQLAMDLGGLVFLDFLGFQKELASALSRSRISTTFVKTCINAETGKITFYLPLANHIPFLKKYVNKDQEITLQGAVSLDTKANFKPGFLFGVNTDLEYLALSGQGIDDHRVGFKYDGDKFFLRPSAYSAWNQPCADAPGKEFLNTVAVNNPPLPKTLLASAEPSPLIIGEAFEKTASSETSWDVEGWKILGVTNDNGNKIIVLDQDNKEIDLKEGSFKIPGVWKYENPEVYIIYSEEEFLNAGYSFAVKKITDLPIEFGIATYTNTTETSHTFAISDFKKVSNTIDMKNLETTERIMINDKPVSAKTIEQRSINPEELKVKADVSNLPTPETQQSLETQFTDLKSPLLKEAVQYLTKANIITGYSDGTFKPEKPINRAEAVTLFKKALRIVPANRGPGTYRLISPFIDVSSSDWYASAVIDAHTVGVIKGYSDNTFKPDQTVNTVEFIKIAMLTEKSYTRPKNFKTALSQFSDLKGTAWYMPFVTYAFDRGYLPKKNKLIPSSFMTRGEAAIMLYRMLKAEEVGPK